MFNLIGNLFTIGFWVVTILLLGVGLIASIGSLISGNTGEKVQAAIALILGVVAFACVYNWCESIPWCLLVTGIAVCAAMGLLKDDSPNGGRKKEKKYTFTDAYIDTYCEYELTKQAVKDAIKESK